jgi:hypothetical protein
MVIFPLSFLLIKVGVGGEFYYYLYIYVGPANYKGLE